MKTLADVESMIASETPAAVDLIEGFRVVHEELEETGISSRIECCRALLIEALQVALAVEITTIPPYLCALWSIKDRMHPVAKSIREVVHEEMLHMALVCNMLAALGETPRITATAPQFPTSLPRGVHPGLTIPLSGLSTEALEVFMAIERPKNVIAHGHGQNLPPSEATVSILYREIEKAFRLLGPIKLLTHRQISGPLARRSILHSLDDVSDAIEKVLRQGEGSDKTPADTGMDDLAHFYRFEEIHVGASLQLNPETDELFHGDRIEFPDVWPMQVVPRSGYQRKDVAGHVWNLLEDFDAMYTRVIDLLQAAWGVGSQADLLGAIQAMFALEGPARSLMEIEVEAGKPATYGPCFRYGGAPNV